MINVEKNNICVREYVQDDFSQFLTQLCYNPKWTNVFELWRQNDENAMKFFAHHLEEYKEYNIKDLGLMLGIFTKSGLLIGECGFEFNKETNCVEIFLGIIENARGNKYSHEVLDALVDISKELGINSIHANVPDAHEIALKIFAKSKFELKNTFDLEVNENLTMKMRHYCLNNK